MNEDPSQSIELLAWLEEPPTAVPLPISVTAPARLPFEQLKPDDFERLVLAVARTSYKVEEARQYGVSGQKQHGIDLYGRLASASDAHPRYVTVQCRNVEVVSPAALTSAVDEFLAGTWAVRSDDFVYATRASLKRTELQEAVETAAARLRVKQIRFEVWDGERLSEHLRDQHGIVSAYFGPATAAVYCLPSVDQAPAEAAATEQSVPTAMPSDSLAFEPATATMLTRPPRERLSAVSLWRSVPPGDLRTIGLGSLKDFSSPHLNSPPRWHADTPPSVGIGISIATKPLLARGPSTSRIRREYLRLLNDSPISELLDALIPERTTEQWRSHNDIGRAHYAAVRYAEADLGIPSAWARLLLAEPDRGSPGLDHRCTYLLLHVDWTNPRTKSALPPIELRQWREMMTYALATPAAVASYLVDHVGVELDDEPSPMIGFWLATPSRLTQLVDLNGLKPVEGSQPSQWYDAYAVADAAGETPNETATDWLTRLCDRALHLDGYEEAI